MRETSGERPGTNDQALSTAIAAAGVPVVESHDGQPAFKTEKGPCAFPVAVCSIRKAGTYLLAGVLERLGLVNTDVHAWTDGFSDYRNCTLEEKQRESERLVRHLPLQTTAQLVGPGQFIVGHLPCDDSVRRSLNGFRTFFITRDLRDALVSHMRFFAQHGRGGPRTPEWKDIADPHARMAAYLAIHGEEFLQVAARMAPWLREPGVLTVSFEALLGDRGGSVQDAAVHAIAGHLGLPGAAVGLLDDVLGSPTLTWSGRRSNRREFWDDRADDFFRAHGGGDLNARFGYDESPSSNEPRATSDESVRLRPS